MCDADNSYGYPYNETIDRLENDRINIYRTDNNGTIVVRSDGGSFSIKAEYKNRIANEDYKKETKKEEPDKNTKKFVGSIDSDKYHYPSCRWAKKIKAENEIWFSSIAKAKSAGYKPCGTCKPPSN